MEGTVIVAAISFAGTLLGTIGGIVTSSRLTNYRLEQLEKKVDAYNTASARIPVMEERIGGIDRRVLRIEKGDMCYEHLKNNNCQNRNAADCYYQSGT